MNDERELEHFKRCIDLIQYADMFGYAISKPESSRRSICMRSKDDKIFISVKDGCYVWYSFKTDKGGSVIEFHQMMTGDNLGVTRKKLRSFTGCMRSEAKPEPIPSNSDAFQMPSEYHQIKGRHRYLESRGINPATLSDERFRGCIYEESYFGNAGFPHINRLGICAFEIKNMKFTRMMGRKVGLWFSRVFKSDTRIAIFESAIDALSYHQIKGDSLTRYVSFAGNPSIDQFDLLHSAILKMDFTDAKVIVATDNDKQGDVYFNRIKDIKLTKAVLIRDAPEGVKDWNDYLMGLAYEKK